MRPNTSFAIVGLLGILCICTYWTTSCNEGAGRTPEALRSDSTAVHSELAAADKIARGHYLVDLGGCHDCHTPKILAPDGSRLDSARLLSGHPENGAMPPMDKRGLKPGYWMLFSPDLTSYIGPWGITFSMNLTPDSATGMGAWSEKNFVDAIRTGRHMGHKQGRPILPPMPWDKFAKMTDEDLRAVYAYLRTIPPYRNRVPAPISVDVAMKKN